MNRFTYIALLLLFCALLVFFFLGQKEVPVEVKTEAPKSRFEISGPQSLPVGQRGVWNITTANPEGKNLYFVTWGDSSDLSSPPPTPFATFEHSYSTAGVYTVKFIVVRNDGTTGTATFPVEVGVNTGMNHQPTMTGWQLKNEEDYYAKVGQVIPFFGFARDIDNDDLVWWVEWDVQPDNQINSETKAKEYCRLVKNTKRGKNYEFSVSHVYDKPGVYMTEAYVTDCEGGTVGGSSQVRITN